MLRWGFIGKASAEHGSALLGLAAPAPLRRKQLALDQPAARIVDMNTYARIF